MRRADAVEDLLVLARDRALSEEDSARLGRAIESSLELKLLLDADYGCEMQTRLLPGDEAKMQRLVERVMQQVDAGALEDRLGDELGDGVGDELGDGVGDELGDGVGDELGDGVGDELGDELTDAQVRPPVVSVYRERIPLHRLRPMLLAAAACLLPVGMAVAWQVVQRSTPASPLDTLATSSSAPAAPQAPPRRRWNGQGRYDIAPAASEVAPAESEMPPAESDRAGPHELSADRTGQAVSARVAGAARSQSSSGERSGVGEPSVQQSGVQRSGVQRSGVQPSGGRRATAAELFAGANLARREGQVERAVRLYEQLIQAYPDSMEAADAHTVLGKLELDRAPASAVWQFRQSRARGSTAEALWGEAESLRRMASPEERAVLERIVREFPNSPYAPAARARLTKLAP